MCHIEEEFEYKGLKCIVLVNHNTIRCGYVAVDKSSPLYGKDYDELNNKVDVHGGVTYSDHLEYVTSRAEDMELWGIGFDCGHYNDLFAVEDALKYGIVEEKTYKAFKHLNDISLSFRPDTIFGVPNVCDTEYVKCEVIRLAEQIKELEDNNEKRLEQGRDCQGNN